MTAITIQLTQNQTTHVMLPLQRKPLSPEEKLKLVLQEMKEASNTLQAPVSGDMQQNLTQWENQFFAQHKGLASTYKEKIQSAIHLGALYFRAESLMLYVAQSNASMLAWKKCCDGLKECLSEMLPEDCSVDQYLATYRQRGLNKKYLVGIEKMKLFFLQLRDGLYLQANNFNEEFMKGFEMIQNQMIEVQDATDLSTEQIYKLMDGHTKNVTQLFLEFGGHMKEMKVIADVLKLHGIALGNTLSEAERILNKV